jgi:hypothetical protein
MTSLRLFLALLLGPVAGPAFLPAPGFSAETKPAGPAGVEQVIVVFKTHFDIGYTQLAREVVERYRTSMIDKALDVCDRTANLPPEHRFVWTLSGWPMTQILWPGQTPERRKRIEKAIREGRLVWHALAGTTHTESMGMEDLVRSLGFSSRLARRFGQPLPRDAKMTDVPCHTWLLPTVLKRAGVDFLHLGCNSASGSPDIPALFWWEGPDGSRLLTMYTAEGYGTDLVPPKGWKFKTWLALIHTGDNHGPPTPQETEALLARAKRELPGVKIRMGRLSDFGDAILAEEKQKPTLPVIAKDMTDTWIHGIMSMPEAAARIRSARPQVGTLESLDTLVRAWSVKTKPVTELIAAAYEGSFLYSEHTWGASSRYYSPRLYGDAWKEALAEGRYKYAEESWEEHSNYVNPVDSAAWELPDQASTLARGIRVDGARIVVFNPSPWKRSDSVLAGTPVGPPRAWKDAVTGEQVAPAFIIKSFGGDLVQIEAASLPPMGYRTYVPVNPVGKESPKIPSKVCDTIENEFFRVQLDIPRGVIRSLVDKRSGKELVDGKSQYGFGQYVFELFDKNDHTRFVNSYCKSHPGWVDEFGRANLPPASDVPYRAASPESFELMNDSAWANEVSSRVLLRAKVNPLGPGPLCFEVLLERRQPFVDINLSLHNLKPDPWPQAGWLCLPFAVDQPTFRLGRPGSVIDPAKDIVRAGNYEMFCLDSGLTIAGRDGRGVGLCAMHSFLVSLGRPGAFRFSREWTPRKPTVFVNLYNNIWGTNFKQWTDEPIDCTVRIWSVEGKGTEADLITPAWETRMPLVAAYADGPAGKLPPVQAGIELSRKGVLVTAFGPNPDGDGILLRLWEQAGQDGVCKVKLPEGLRGHKARPCDLRGRVIEGTIASHDGLLEVPLTHFAPASVLLIK